MINLYHQAQKKNGNSATTVKSAYKSDLIATAVKISDSAVSYAVSKKDAVLEMGVKVTKSGLANLSQLVLLDTLTLFYNKVQPLNGSLKHLEAGDVEKLNQLLKSFKASLPKPSADSNETKTATQNIGDTIKEINGLYQTLDKHIAPFKYNQPGFYNDYTNSRMVKDLKGKGKKKEGEKK